MPEHAFKVWSSGDRVRVRLQLPDSPGLRPLVLWLGSDGSAEAPELAALGADWDWCALASLDLPLCGARASEKLSIAAFDPAHALHAALSGDAVAQLEGDLERVLETLAARPGLDTKRLRRVALGRGALLAERSTGFLERTAARLVAPDANPDPGWFAAECQRLRLELS
jgi:hypothetical protein